MNPYEVTRSLDSDYLNINGQRFSFAPRGDVSERNALNRDAERYAAAVAFLDAESAKDAREAEEAKIDELANRLMSSRPGGHKFSHWQDLARVAIAWHNEQAES